MNNFLISIGAAIVAVLIAAFVAPAFVDWNGYRDRLEDEARRVLCRDVKITGDLDVKLLPEPVVKTGLIEVKGHKAAVLASSAGATLTLGLSALLLGSVEVTALELVRPVFSFSAATDGEINWGQSGFAGCKADVANVKFRRVGITDGTIRFNSAAMDTKLTLENVNASLTAGGLAGPYKFSGSHGLGDVQRGFSISSGRINQAGATRVSGRLAVDERTEFTFDGQVMSDGGAPRFSGIIKTERALTAEGGAVASLKAESKSDISATSIELSELLLTATDDNASSSATGSARIVWRDSRPHIAVDLKARRVDVSALVAGERASQSGMAQLLGQASQWVRDQKALGRISLAIDGALYRDELVQDVSVSFNLGNENLGVETMKAVLPGQSQFDFTGNLLEGGSGDKLLGTLVLNTRDLKRLLAWGVPASYARFVRMVPQTQGKLSITGGLRAEIGMVELTGIEGLIDGSSFSGDMSFDLSEPGEVYAALTFDELDLDRLIPKEFALVDALMSGPDTAPEAAPAIGLEIEARRAKWRGREARGLALTGEYAGNHLRLERFELSDFASGDISGSGEIRFAPGGPEGGVDLHLKSRDIPAFALAFGVDLGRLTKRGPGWLALVRDGNFDARVETKHDQSGWDIAARIDGKLGGTGVAAAFNSPSAPTDLLSGRMEGEVRLAAPDAGRLFAQLGLSGLPAATPDSPGKLSFNAAGSQKNGFGYSARFEGFDATASARGSIQMDPARVEGRASFAAEDSNRIADLIGVGWHAPVLPETSLAMDFDLQSGRLDISAIKGRLAGAVTSGSALVQIAGERAATVDLVLDQFSIPWALTSLFSSARGSTVVPEARAGVLWSTELINSAVLDRWPVNVNLQTGQMDLAGDISLTEGLLKAEIGDGKLVLDRLEGTLEDDGHFLAQGEIRRSDLSLNIQGKIKAEGFGLGRVLTDKEEQPLMEGKLGADLNFTATGRSLLSLASSLAGNGTMRLKDASLPRVDAGNIVAGARVDRSARPTQSLSATPSERSTPLKFEAAPMVASSGRVEIGPVKVTSHAGGLSGQARGYLNLVAGRIDQDIQLGSGDGPRLGVIHAGPFGDILRQYELTDLSVGTVQWREGDHVPERQGNAGNSAAPALSAEERNRLPTGVIEQKVFELPLANDG